MKSLERVPPSLQSTVASLIGSLIRRASVHGAERWGLTDYGNGIRLNVGWTEILTTMADHVRLIVGNSARETPIKHAELFEGEDERGIYPSIPGSLLAEVPYQQRRQLFLHTVDALRPALFEAVDLAARRRVGRGVRNGHSPALVSELQIFLGEDLPHPGYGSDDGQDSGAARMEGALARVLFSRYERDKVARDRCIAYYGAVCAVCNFSFEKTYGELGAGFIHVHHLIPLSEIGHEYRVDPINHLRPVCPNCHAMLHLGERTLGIEELRATLSR